MRRLPIYLVIGTGESMRGEPIESVKNGLQMLVAALRKDPQVLETAWLSIIAFGDSARKLVPLTPLESFEVPQLEANGGCALGAALDLVRQCVSQECVPSTTEKKGDWRPMVLVFTDRTPTDSIQAAVMRFRTVKWGAAVCCVAGPQADKEILEAISPGCVVDLGTADQSTLAGFFYWDSWNRDGTAGEDEFATCGSDTNKNDLESVVGASGCSYPYLRSDNPSCGAWYDSYLSPDGSYEVSFLKSRLDARDIDRIRNLVGPARKDIFDVPNGKYWEKLFRWPIDMVEDGANIAMIVPTCPRNFRFSFEGKTFGISGGVKEGKFFTDPWHRYCNLNPREIGHWRSYVDISMLLARGVRRLHEAGFAMGNFAYKEVLLDPVKGGVHFVGLDYNLVVPGKFPSQVMGTPDFMAPEVYATMHLAKSDPNRKLPCQETDLHALAVWVYLLLLCRHPLEGCKIWDAEDEQRDRTLAFGEKAVFIEDPTNKINRYTVDWVKNNQPKSRLPYMLPWMDLDKLPYTVLGPYLKDLFDRALITGLHNPSLRPKAFEWEDGLIQTMDLMIPCQNPQCKQKWFVFDNSASNPKCPFCGEPYKIPLPVLNLYNRSTTSYKPTGTRVMVYNGTRLYQWHSDPRVARNEKLTDEQKKSIACFQFHQGKWYLRNERAKGMMDLQTKKLIPAGSVIELKDGVQIRLDDEQSRMIHVQMVNK